MLLGDVVLENLKLKREALKRLNFPIEVHRGWAPFSPFLSPDFSLGSQGTSLNALVSFGLMGSLIIFSFYFPSVLVGSFALFSCAQIGYLGTLRLKIPWKKLKTEPVIVEISDIYALAVPKVALEVLGLPQCNILSFFLHPFLLFLSVRSHLRGREAAK